MLKTAAALITSLLAFLFVTDTVTGTAEATRHRITATPGVARITYFNVVDESTVPSMRAGERPPAPMEPWEPELAPYGHVAAQNGRIATPADLQVSAGDALAKGRGLTVRAFDGMDEPYAEGVGRPDQAIAAGPRLILQVINTKIAIYDRSGMRLPGWPKEASRFFGLPPSHYMVDPRAAYDPWNHRYYVAFLDQEVQHTYFLAVSKTSDPSAVWYVYGFDVAPGAKEYPDFTMFGFDRDTVSISSRVDTIISRRNITLSNGIFVLPKSPLERGSTKFEAVGFRYVSIGGTALDTLQPLIVEPMAKSAPPAHVFLSTYGFNFSCYGGVPKPCRQMFAFAVTLHGSHAELSHAVITMPPYAFSPSADLPECHNCLEAVGPMIDTAPVYSRGVADFAFGLGIPSSQRYGAPGIIWGQLQLSFSGGTLAAGSLAQSGIVGFPSNQAAFMPSVMTDPAGDFFLVFDSSGPKLNPGVFVAAHRPSDPAGVMTSMQVIKNATGTPPPGAWGDFTASSYSPDTGVWCASQFAKTATVYGDEIANVRLR